MSFPNFQSEVEVLTFMTWLLVVFALFVFSTLAATSYVVAYGKHGDSPSWVERMFYLDKLYLPAKLAWFIQEFPAFVVPTFMLLNGQCKRCLSWSTNDVVMFMYFSHYVHRSFIFPLLIRGGKPMPAHWNFVATAFCGYNGYLQSAYHCSFASYPPGYMWNLIPIIGIISFYSGMFINISSDCILRNLRKPGETGYKIPRGLAFEYVSGANFFGEILEWWGFAFLAGSLPATAFAFMTTCNLIPRARAHHNWYLQKFDDYPKSRRAVIPFVL